MSVRGWCWTLNNYTATELDDIKALNREENSIKYTVYGFEIGEQKTPHLQGYTYFANARTLAGVKLLYPRAHLEKQRGTFTQAIEYCKKDGSFEEYGRPPMDSREKGETQKAKWRKINDLAKAGNWVELDEEYPMEYLLHYNKLLDLYNREQPVPEDLDGPLSQYNHWLWGPPGTGKSFSARAMFESHYPKSLNKWWDDYKGEDAVIIEDIELDSLNMKHHIKIWADRYNFVAQVKGNHMRIRPKHIIITSNYSIEEIFADDPQLREAIKRRFKVTHYNVPFQVQPHINN